jgi:hypothetical protein
LTIGAGAILKVVANRAVLTDAKIRRRAHAGDPGARVGSRREIGRGIRDNFNVRIGTGRDPEQKNHR